MKPFVIPIYWGLSRFIMTFRVRWGHSSTTTVLTKLQALVFLVTAVVLVLTMICVATIMTAVVAEHRKESGGRTADTLEQWNVFFPAEMGDYGRFGLYGSGV